MEAFRAVPRHRFVRRFFANDPRSGAAARWEIDEDAPDAGALALVYDPVHALALNEAGTSTISAPDVVATMLDALELAPGHRVLEIGTGSGFNAALLATLVGSSRLVTTVDIDGAVAAAARAALARNGFQEVRVVEGDGALGVPGGGPFDRVVATVGCTDVAPAWIAQLASGGAVVVPLEHGGAHPVLRLSVVDEVHGTLAGRVVTPAAFVRIAGSLDRPLPWSPSAGRAPIQRGGSSRDLPADLRGAWAGRHRLWDVAFHVALVDARAARAGVLHDRAGSWAALESTATVLTAAGPHGDDLGRALVDAAREWVALGSPAAGDYRSRFVRREGGDPGSSAEWVVPRPHHVQLVSLG